MNHLPMTGMKTAFICRKGRTAELGPGIYCTAVIQDWVKLGKEEAWSAYEKAGVEKTSRFHLGVNWMWL